MGRRLCAGAAAAALAILVAPPAHASGGCVDVGCMFEGFESLPLYLLLVTGTLVGVGADVYYTPGVLANAFEGRGPSSDTALHEVYWTGWQSALVFVGTGYGAAVNPSALGPNGEDGARGWLALSTWPYAITAHGIWYASDDPLARYPVPGLIGATDTVLLAYDVYGLASGRRYSALYPVLEIFTAALQTTYGVAWATHQRGGELTRTLALSSIPALMTVHGVTALILGPPDAPAPDRSSLDTRQTGFNAAPMLMARPGGAELCLLGTW